ncbi:MAG: hypothetical protein UZ22_OP11002000760 [Microgenomates bacterium OLB23]|nr:MAG: hypothetical protein UZ22_OP11002000760 [Microgenomates bacterium OLB23]
MSRLRPTVLFASVVVLTAGAFGLLIAISAHVASGEQVWSALGGLSGAMGVAITIGGVFLLWSQLEQAHRERSVAAFTEAFRLLMNGEQVDARRWIYTLPNDAEQARALILVTPENHQRYKSVLNAFDYLGFLVTQYPYVDEDVIKWIRPVVQKTWAKLGPIVEEEALRRGEPGYYQQARKLARLCGHLQARHTWMSDAL